MPGASVDMKVTGVSQFRQDINKVQNSMKTLDAALQLNEKQFKATGDAETYMKTKAELLQTRMEQQNSIIKQAQDALDQMSKQGVDKASSAFQEMQRKVISAQSGLLDTKQQLENIGQSGEEAGNGVDKMNTQLQRIGQNVSFQNVTKGISSITRGIENAARKAGSLGKKILEATLGAAGWADQLATDAKVFGMTPQELQAARYTEQIIDTSVETIVSAKKKLKKARAGESKETMGAFAALGIDPNTAKDAEDLFWKTGEAIMKMGDEYDQEDYAQKLLGKSWQELVPLFEAGREEYEKMNKSWNVLSDDQLNSLTSLDDEYQKLNANFENLKMTALSQFAEPMATAMQEVNIMVTKFTDWLNSDEGQATMAKVVEGIQGAFQWISEHRDEVENAIKAIGLAFLGLKVAEAAAHIGQFLSGLKGLTGGGKSGTPTTGTGTGTGKVTGGWWTGAKNALTAAGGKISNVLANMGGAANGVPVLDWLTHNTGIGQEYILGTKAKGSTWEEIKQNFVDWGDTAMAVAMNNYQFWKGQHNTLKEAQEWNLGEDASISDVMAFMEAQEKANSAADKMNQAAEELTGTSGSQKQANSEMTQAAEGMKGMPAAVADAIKQIRFSIYLDGGEMTNYFNRTLGAALEASSP